MTNLVKFLRIWMLDPVFDRSGVRRSWENYCVEMDVCLGKNSQLKRRLGSGCS